MKKKAKKPLYSKYLPALADNDVRIPERVTGGRIIQAFVYADLRLMLPGLLQIMYGHGIKAVDLKPGQCVPFMNTARTYIKVIVGNGTPWPVLACYRLPPGAHMPVEAVTDIYQAFSALASPLAAEERLRLALEKYGHSKRRERLTTRQLRDVTPGQS